MFTAMTTIKLIIYKNKYDLILPRNKDSFRYIL